VDLENVKLDFRAGKVFFNGTCSEMRQVCQAWCCRRSDWIIAITAAEYASGLYQADIVCSLNGKECKVQLESCRYRTYHLNKRADKSCVYLEDNRCTIYEIRPQICRDFQCQAGWRLDSVFSPENDTVVSKTAKLTCDRFVEEVGDDAVFVQHPLIKLHALFFLPSKKQIIFIKELISGCGKFNSQDSLNIPGLTEAKLQLLIDLFNRKESVVKLYNRFCSEGGIDLTRQEFISLLWLLNKHQIVIEAGNLRGLLAGMGGID